LQDKIIHLHFFIAGCDWYAVEWDGDDLFFGYAILNNDYHNAEWGYVSFAEIKSINIGGLEIDCELAEYFKPRMASEIDKICKGMLWGKYAKPIVNIEDLLTMAEDLAEIELQCSKCGTTLTCEPDAKDAFCFDCGEVVPTNNPLIANGLI